MLAERQADEVDVWLKDWFAARMPDIELTPDQNYFDAGAIDSFGAIELIEEIEDRFAIQLTEQDFQNRDFVTLGGLAGIIRARQGG
jgi:acyl carrier protein